MLWQRSIVIVHRLVRHDDKCCFALALCIFVCVLLSWMLFAVVVYKGGAATVVDAQDYSELLTAFKLMGFHAKEVDVSELC